MSNVAYPSVARRAAADTRSAPAATTSFPATVPEAFVQSPPPMQQPDGNTNSFQAFVQQAQMQQPQNHNRVPSLDKELPPVPLGSADMAMDLDLSMFGDAPGALLMPPDLGEDWTSRANTLVGSDPNMAASLVVTTAANHHFSTATGWPDIHMFGTDSDASGEFR